MATPINPAGNEGYPAWALVIEWLILIAVLVIVIYFLVKSFPDINDKLDAIQTRVDALSSV